MTELTQLICGELFFFHPMLDDASLSRLKGNPRFLGACDRRHTGHLLKYFSAGREIRALMRDVVGVGDVDIYVPHPFNPLSNYAFFLSESSRKYIYQDGLLNYYDATSPLASWKRLLKQKTKSACIGLPYKAYTGHLSGIDSSSIAGGFFTHPEKIVQANKFQRIEKLYLRTDAGTLPSESRSGTLFLDQPIEQIVGNTIAHDLRQQTIDYVNELEGPVFYKPHYAQKADSSFGPTWKTLDRHACSLPAELLVAKLNVKSVVSFCSSALANIALSHDSINCYATAADMIRISVNGRPTTLAEVLSALGVTIAKLHH